MSLAILKSKSKGFTLVELMIGLAIFAIISVVISKLFLSGMRGWMYSRASIFAQQKARMSRDLFIKRIRNVSASSVIIDRYDSNQPVLSMISYIDQNGKQQAFYQKDGALYVAPWTLVSGVRVTNDMIANPIISEKVRRLVFYYPNVKDLQNINFSIYMYWLPFADAGKPVEIQLVGDIEMRNP